MKISKVTKTAIKKRFPAGILKSTDRLLYLWGVFEDLRGRRDFTCNICGYVGRFFAVGRPPRYNAECRSCGSLERHRLFFAWLQQQPSLGTKAVLHFSPERMLAAYVRARARSYVSCDLEPGVADRVIDVEAIDLPDQSVDLTIILHVLEHVDDYRALPELYRITKPRGVVTVMSPVIEGWAHTYENRAVSTPSDRLAHFGQSDHMRYYGADLRDRIKAAGFSLSEFTAEEPLIQRYALARGDKVFVATRPS